ncbi:hypothetical protein B0H14DRAFT_3158739 [Mycena olivaceomarginata]|nr:hypothetical protein B0H14DRAFT_3158739 [Mycena olivaceomarginata]
MEGYGYGSARGRPAGDPCTSLSTPAARSGFSRWRDIGIKSVIRTFSRSLDFIARHRVNSIVKNIDSNFYAAAQEVRAKTEAKLAFAKCLGHGDPLMFEGRQLLMNRETPDHRDKSDPRNGWAILFAGGNATEADMLARELGLRTRFRPGDAIAIRGRSHPFLCGRDDDETRVGEGGSGAVADGKKSLVDEGVSIDTPRIVPDCKCSVLHRGSRHQDELGTRWRNARTNAGRKRGEGDEATKGLNAQQTHRVFQSTQNVQCTFNAGRRRQCQGGRPDGEEWIKQGEAVEWGNGVGAAETASPVEGKAEAARTEKGKCAGNVAEAAGRAEAVKQKPSDARLENGELNWETASILLAEPWLKVYSHPTVPEVFSHGSASRIQPKIYRCSPMITTIAPPPVSLPSASSASDSPVEELRRDRKNRYDNNGLRSVQFLISKGIARKEV